MAKGLQNTSSAGTRSFDKELNEDVNDFHLPPNSWTQARNAINNSVSGDLGKLGNEPSNIDCLINSLNKPYTIIGVIHLEADIWAIYSTDDINSEIGIFTESKCGTDSAYVTAVNDPCLNFRKTNLIKGVSRLTSECNYELYWDDGRNPSRLMNVVTDNPSDNAWTNPNSPIPWKQTCVPPVPTPNVCTVCTNTSQLDCDQIRLAKYINVPCVRINKGVTGGTIPNGSVFIAIAYSINGVKVSDYYISNVQPLFEHNNTASSIDVVLESIDTRFDEFICVLVSTINQQTVARQAGIYSTSQTLLSFDIISDTWPSVPIEQIPIMNPVADKTDAMFDVNDYLIRVGPTSKQDFNYQPRANQIVAKWVSVEYDAKYYRNGGNNTGYMRDEVYPFSIRWVYDTGDKTSLYHIPGRPAFAGEQALVATDALSDEIAGGFNYRWVVENTATGVVLPPTTLQDGGVVLGEGYMGYWESSELYPNEQPQVWNANIGGAPYPGTNPADYDLCNKPIRHHRFPEESTLNTVTELYNNGVGDRIRIMGVKFENILPPVLNDGVTPVPGIVGYEILRGSRKGNKTIIAKGIINNMGMYNIEDGNPAVKGYYPNYPYNDITNDPFLSTSKTSRGFSFLGALNNENGYNPQNTFSNQHLTFHSPDTNFFNPFLNAKELKIYGNVYGEVIGSFRYSEKHPKEKIITNLTFLISAIAGIGIAATAINGSRTTRYVPPASHGYSKTDYVRVSDTLLPGGTTTQTGGPLPTPAVSAITIPYITLQNSSPLVSQPSLTDIAAIPAVTLALFGGETAFSAGWYGGAPLASAVAGGTIDSLYSGFLTGQQGLTAGTWAFSTATTEYTQEETSYTQIPGPIRAFGSLPMFFNYFTEGTDSILRLIRAIVKYTDFVLRYDSHGFYNSFAQSVPGNKRKEIDLSQYIGPQLTDFGTTARINNLYRARTVALRTTQGVGPTTVSDRTRYKVSDINSSSFIKNPTDRPITPYSNYIGSVPANNFGRHQICSSHYAALKQRLRNQYGQLTNITHLPIPMCVVPLGTPNSEVPVLFGGDIYIGRYTEKNSFFYFYDWLYDQPDGAQLDYDSRKMFSGLYPRFWANFNEFETTDFTSTVFSNVFPVPNVGAWTTPSDYYNLDALSGFSLTSIRFAVKNAWMYLFNSGVRDFFVESEINVDLRDWGNQIQEEHYDPYRFTDTKALFDTNVIKIGNYYKYDQSLSISKLFINYVSWGSMQPRNYDPDLAETCYTYTPNKVIYSLPQQFESLKDSWSIFLANNYTNFLAKVTCIKPINKSGALIFFDTMSPIQFQGLDQLQTDLGTKLTIGDGGLFSQPMQNLLNADRPYEYGSCQDRLSVINTPMGTYWISQNQGKIFQLQNGIEEISMTDLKWWFATYLPYKLTQQFPNFSLIDNPVIGIGCQTIYDNENQLVYFTKRDFIVRKDLPLNTTIEYINDDNFMVMVDREPLLAIKLGNLDYFEDASWTVSYDPKTKGWLSWHDWHPNLLIPGKNTFLSVKDSGIWLHNAACNSYCNYYGVNYPFEVEYMVNTIQTVNTLRSIEYIMEVYKYDGNCHDRFHVLDYNFDEAVIYNTEQVSGLLRLNLNPKNNPFAAVQYPIVNPTSIDIVYSKEENKYRFNQFWDITDDRGEYNPAAQRMIWNTAANGYVRVLNPNNLNYSKDPLQRKKFRHYTNSVFLRKKADNAGQPYKILVMLTNNKNLYSPR